jgi:hypothetical protein
VPIGSAEYLKERNPTCEVAVRDLEGKERDDRHPVAEAEMNAATVGNIARADFFSGKSRPPIETFAQKAKDCRAPKIFGRIMVVSAMFQASYQQNIAACCCAATDLDLGDWHSGPACGTLRAPHAGCRDHAGYAYCQLRDTQLSVKTWRGHGPRSAGLLENRFRCF